MNRRAGYTFAELVVVLLLLSILLAASLPRLGRWRDAAAVRAARNELAGAIGWTRLAAATGGGAALVLEPATGVFWTERSDGARTPAIDLRGRYGVAIDAGAGATIELAYDGYGIGRLASRTIEVRRGSARGGVTISSYGRIRQW